MTRRHASRLSLPAILLVLGVAAGCRSTPTPSDAARPPNVVLIFPDDLGYGDLGPFGATDISTPNVDRLAREGIRLTDFYVAQPVCTASRAALLTGSYSNRVGLIGALNPDSPIGISADETTLPELLQAQGYATAIYGKWHLGDAPEFSPLRHGFDEFVGLPYSNDMWPPNGDRWPPLPLIENETVTAEVTDEIQATLTAEFTGRATAFIDRHRDQPFFVYLPHPMPHVPIFASEPFEGRSSRGLYGDVIEEIDWSVGEILDAIARNGLDEQTLVLFVSDNGPWIQYGDHGGSAGGLREGKHTTFDGGIRVPFLARWPGRIPAGSSRAIPAMTIDLLPMLAGLAGAALPSDRTIDGHDLWPWLAGGGADEGPHDALYFYNGRQLHAVRSGRWKLHVPHPWQRAVPNNGGERGRYEREQIGLMLFDLVADPGETTDVSAEHPEIVDRLMRFVERARADLGDALTEREGADVREPGRRSQDQAHDQAQDQAGRLTPAG